MKTIKMMLLAGVLILSFVSTANAGKPDPVSAVDCAYFDGTHTHACGADLDNLCYAIDSAGSLGDRDRDTMVSKTIGADIKVEEGKNADAVDKLYRIELKLDSLLEARKPKIDEDDYNAISIELTEAQFCVGNL